MTHEPPYLVDTSRMRRYAAPGQCVESVFFKDRGTLGVIAVDRLTGDPVALTAMHVVPGIEEYPSPLHDGTIFFEAPCASGSTSLLGQLLRGTRKGIDAAVISIEQQPPSNFVDGIGSIELWRSVRPEADKNAPVRLAGAASGRVNHGRIVKPVAAAPAWGLTSAILVEIRALPGDSGAPLVDEDGVLLGLLVGGDSTRHLFTPIDLVFDRLDCNLF